MPKRLTVRVLVVDDDREDARLVEDLLASAKRARFTVEKAESSEAGLKALEESKFDVVLLDYRLPDGDGLDFVRRIYEKLHYKVPVVIITSHGDRGLQARAIEAGAAEYLEKGTFNAELLERTCIYAIGLYEKQTRNGSGPGVGVNIETLVSLTRESVKAQTNVATEMRELRGVVAGTADDAKKDRERVRDDVLYEVRSLSRMRWMLDWVRQNPLASIVMFLCFVVIAVLGVVLINQLDTDKLKTLKDAATGALQNGETVLSCLTG